MAGTSPGMTMPGGLRLTRHCHAMPHHFKGALGLFLTAIRAPAGQSILNHIPVFETHHGRQLPIPETEANHDDLD
jgi:hypothetical protein